MYCKGTCYILYINVINIILYNLCKRVGDLSFTLYKNRVPFRQIYISTYMYTIFMLTYICSYLLIVFIICLSLWFLIVVDLRRYFRTARCCPRLWPAPLLLSHHSHSCLYRPSVRARGRFPALSWSHMELFANGTCPPVIFQGRRVCHVVTSVRLTHIPWNMCIYVCDARANITTVSHLHTPPQRYHPFFPGGYIRRMKKICGSRKLGLKHPHICILGFIGQGWIYAFLCPISCIEDFFSRILYFF